MTPSQQLTYIVPPPLYSISMSSSQQLSYAVLSFQQSSSTVLSLQHTSTTLLNVISRISIPSLLTLSTSDFTSAIWFTTSEPIVISDDDRNSNLFMTSNSGHHSKPRKWRFHNRIEESFYTWHAWSADHATQDWSYCL